MATIPSTRDESLLGNSPLEHARGLADLAFGSFTQASDLTQVRHLALLPAESLELDLSNPAQRQFGDYELLELIGEGGMGVVYRARQMSLDREVAVKLLSAGPWASREFIARFEREAQNAARMQHPAIVTVYEVGSFEGIQFFSMRLVSGESLSTRLKRGEKFTPCETAVLMRTVAEAVAYAHSLGVLHLDLKPANVLIDEVGQPYVADFGLARRLENALAVDNDEVSGTPAYMAPEQAQVRANKLTAATDIWGLGAILYELLTGRPPFRGESAQDTVKLVLESQVRAPRRWAPMVPLDLEAIVMHCLTRDPRGRYPSARALADDLARFIEGRPVQARPLNGVQKVFRWTRREPKLAATLACAILALIIGLVATSWQWHRARSNADTARVNALTATQRLWDSRDESALRYMESADGWKAVPLLLANLVEMEARGDHERARNVRKRLGIIENANPKLIDVLPASPGTYSLAFSPDAKKLAATPMDVFDLRLFDLASGKELWRTRDANSFDGDAQVTPDHIAFDARGDSILVSDPLPVASAPFPFGVFMHRVDARTGKWTLPPHGARPNGRQSEFLAYTADARLALDFLDSGNTQIWRTDPWNEVASASRSTGMTGSGGPVLFAPDDRSFAFRRTDDKVIELYAPHSLKRIWSFDPAGFGPNRAWAFSPDSRWLAVGDQNGAIWVADCVKHTLRRLSPQPLTGVRQLRFSADGAWLAAATGAGGIYLWRWPDGTLLVPPFAADLKPERVRLDHAHGRVLASGSHGEAALWQIPEMEFEMDRGEAVPLGDRFALLPGDTELSLQKSSDAVAWAPAQGLLAHVAVQRVQLERLPPSVLKRAHAAPIPPTRLHFDGRRLVTVAGNEVRIVDAVTERPIRTFELPQPAGFAELSLDGRTLVATAGRKLYAWDARSGQPRFAPVALDDSPQHVALAPDGTRAAIGWLEHDAARGVSEAIELRDLRSGKSIAPAVRLFNPQQGLTFSPDGTRLLAWSITRLSLRDGFTLRPIAGPLADLRVAPHDNLNEGWIRDAAFDTGNGVWTSLTRAKNVHSAQNEVEEIRHYPAVGGVRKIHSEMYWIYQALLPLPDGAVALVRERSGLELLDTDGSTKRLPDVQRNTQRAEIAASADGRWLARAQKDSVVLFDANEGTRIATLRSPLSAPDVILQLAFSPDGNRLLARSLRNRLLVWNLAPDQRGLPQIARELELRDVPLSSDRSETPAEPTAAERAALRAADPGAQPDIRPKAQPVARLLPGGPIAPRAADAPPQSFDLTTLYNFGLSKINRASSDTASDFAWLPQGTQRWLGVDFDVRGGIQLQAAQGGADVARGNNPSSINVRPPSPILSAVDILMLTNSQETDGGVHVLRATMHYADGGESSQWISENDNEYYPTDGGQLWVAWRLVWFGKTARLATFGYDARRYAMLPRRTHVYSVRIVNPQPQRPVRNLTFMAAKFSGASAVILAITGEPRAPPAPSK
ncbi:MAG TPA: protein kinase [Rhodanobacteraceae bacterium]